MKIIKTSSFLSLFLIVQWVFGKPFLHAYFFFQKITPVSGSPTPVLGEGEPGRVRNLVIFEDKANNHTNEKVSWRALH